MSCSLNSTVLSSKPTLHLKRLGFENHESDRQRHRGASQPDWLVEEASAGEIAPDLLISQDGCGRAFDNIFVERLWRSVKSEEVYLKNDATAAHAIECLGAYFQFYNHQRLHQALDDRPPAIVHFGSEGVPKATR